MEEIITTKIKLPKSIDTHIKSLTNSRYNYNDRLRVWLATGLFVEKEISLAEAAELAGMSLYEYITYLKLKGVPAYEYTEEEFEMDKKFIRR